jgi:methanethiol S-methyltransferase
MPNTMSYFLLAALWLGWCALHSALIATPFTSRLRRWVGAAFRWYRLFYNTTAVLTLVPVIIYSQSLKTSPFLVWAGWSRVVQFLMVATATGLFLAGSRRYDLRQFLGLRRIGEENVCLALSESCELKKTGVLGVIRHPWYVGGMLLVWARDLDLSAGITNLVLTGYFVLGAVLEERKLVQGFGEAYRRYQKEVSMFFPWKSIMRRVRGRRRDAEESTSCCHARGEGRDGPPGNTG